MEEIRTKEAKTMMKISRLLSYAVVCLLVVPGALRAQPADVAGLALYEGADREQRLVKGARAEREINLYSSLVVEDLTALAAAFEKKYGVKLKFWRAGSEKVVQRAVTEARAGRSDVDVIETNGPELESLHREKLLQRAGSPHFPDLMPEAIRPHREWVGTRLNMFVHAYNTNLVKKDELPKSYQDFLHPRWKGRLGIEAEDIDWFAMVVKELGEDKGLRLFRDIVAKNGLSVRRGHTLLAGLVASGEVPFALTVYNHNAEKLKQRGAPVDWYAIQPAIARVNGVALSRKPPHPHAAVLFYDFILGEGQAILVKGNYVPTNRKADSVAVDTKLKFVDPTAMLDESAKWEKLYTEIITRQSK
jgi:iron(III) transport system substrate-binding protein